MGANVMWRRDVQQQSVQGWTTAPWVTSVCVCVVYLSMRRWESFMVHWAADDLRAAELAKGVSAAKHKISIQTADGQGWRRVGQERFWTRCSVDIVFSQAAIFIQTLSASANNVPKTIPVTQRQTSLRLRCVTVWLPTGFRGKKCFLDEVKSHSDILRFYLTNSSHVAKVANICQNIPAQRHSRYNQNYLDPIGSQKAWF